MVSGPGELAASQRIAGHLRSAILAGEILPGERIRQEQVAERLAVSRLPVREALRMLEVEGLVEQEPNKGARVPIFDARELDLLYQMRERLEPLALIESINGLSESDLDQLDDLHQRISDCTDVGEFMLLDRELHLLSYARCDMEPLSSMVLRMWNSTQHYRRQFMNLVGNRQRWIVNAEHGLLLDAIRRRDAVDAARCLEGHIRRTRVELSKHPEVFSAGPTAAGPRRRSS